MNESCAGVRPETLALDILIKQTIEQGHSRSSSRLFSDNRHTTFPVMVIQDPVLEPVDKLVWMAICLQLHECGGDAIFPTYDKIAKTANVSSSATVSRALTILRLSRWLTLCTNHTMSSVASDVGRGVQGNAYVLHDESLPLMDTNYLDPSYQSFLRESTEHYHARVKTVARGLLEEVDEGIELDGNASAEEQPIVSSTQRSEHVEKKELRRYFSYSGKVMNELRNLPDKDCPGHTVQNVKEVEKRVQNLKATRSNTKNLYPQNLKTVRKKDSSLIYPRRISERQRDVVDRHLSCVPANQRQALLDEMEGRIRAEQLGMKPLFDELNYLKTLCNALNKGMFELNLGIKVEEERKARKRARDKKIVDQIDQSDSQKLEELRREIRAGRGPLADIRKILRMPNSSRNEA
jgi:hypothetical protein